MFHRFLLNRFYFRADGAGDGGGGGNAGNTETGNDGGDPGKGADDGGQASGKTFSQEEVDKIVDNRLKRDRKAREAELEAERKKAEMSETEKAKADKEDADKKAKDAEVRANRRIIRAEAKVAALAAGVKAERIDYLLKLADLDGIEVGDDGEPDADAVKTAIESVLKDLPELVGTTATNNADEREKGDPGTTLTEDAILDMSPEETAKRMPEIEKFYKNKK